MCKKKRSFGNISSGLRKTCENIHVNLDMNKIINTYCVNNRNTRLLIWVYGVHTPTYNTDICLYLPNPLITEWCQVSSFILNGVRPYSNTDKMYNPTCFNHSLETKVDDQNGGWVILEAHKYGWSVGLT